MFAFTERYIILTIRIYEANKSIYQSFFMAKNHYNFLINVLRERVQIHGFRTITTVFYLPILKLNIGITV